MANEPDVLDPGAVWRSVPAQPYRLSASEVNASVARLERRLPNKFVLTTDLFAFEIAAYGWCFLALDTFVERVVAMLIVGALAFSIMQVRLHAARRSSTAVNVMKVTRPSVEFYRDMLERRLDFHLKRRVLARLALFPIGAMVLTFGLRNYNRTTDPWLAIQAFAFVGVLVLLVWLQTRRARAYELRIKELNLLEGDLWRGPRVEG
jgi:hypothetical protein